MHALVVTRLSELLPTLPRAERRVARVLLAEYPLAAHQSIASLAEQAQVSGPTVLRLAKRLGFEGFPELREAVWRDTATRQASPLTLYPRAAPRDGSHVIARSDKLFHGKGARLDETVDRAQFDAVADLLADQNRRIFTGGGRFSQLITGALALHLEVVRPGIRHVTDAEQVRCLLDARRSDVLVLIDLRRYQRDTVTFGERASEAGMTVVLITDPWMSPLAATAHKLLIVPGMTLGAFDSLVPSLSLVEALGAAVVERLGDRARDRMARYDALWRDRGVADGRALRADGDHRSDDTVAPDEAASSRATTRRQTRGPRARADRGTTASRNGRGTS